MREPMTISFKRLLNLIWLVSIFSSVGVLAQTRSAGEPGGGTVIAMLHAEGAQIYECRPDTSTSSSRAHPLTWQFREPIATLIVGGQSIGRHYAGPNWDYVDGSGVKGRVVASRPGATPKDIPWLEIEVVEHRNQGMLSDATSVQRINTRGGMAQGTCETAGGYLSIPYAADYLFLHKS
jgi:Protein of unknown function (DUF3455)